MDRETMTILAVGVPETAKFFIKGKMTPIAIEYRSARTTEEILRALSIRDPNLGCALIDADNLDDRGEIASKAVRSVIKALPIFILSSEQDKSFYVSAVRWGVSGFIIKPFKDDSIRTKLMECYYAQSEKKAEIISFKLEKYLLGEFRKAEKGNFGLSFMFASVVLNDPEERDNLMSQAYYLNMFYESIKGLLWDTDALIRFNSRYYLGVFPFCTQSNLEVLSRKMAGYFNSLHKERGVPNYVKLEMAFSSYPEDGSHFLEVQRKLVDRIRAKMGDIKLDWLI